MLIVDASLQLKRSSRNKARSKMATDSPELSDVDAEARVNKRVTRSLNFMDGPGVFSSAVVEYYQVEGVNVTRELMDGRDLIIAYHRRLKESNYDDIL